MSRVCTSCFQPHATGADLCPGCGSPVGEFARTHGGLVPSGGPTRPLGKEAMFIALLLFGSLAVAFLAHFLVNLA